MIQFSYLGTTQDPVVVERRFGSGRCEVLAARGNKALAVVELNPCTQAALDMLRAALDIANSPGFAEHIQAQAAAQADPSPTEPAPDNAPE